MALSARVACVPNAFSKDSLTEFLQRNPRDGQWVPEQPEPTIVGGEPPPRRRGISGRRSKLATHVAIGDPIVHMPEAQPPDNPKITVTDAQLREAFGPSPMFPPPPINHAQKRYYGPVEYLSPTGTTTIPGGWYTDAEWLSISIQAQASWAKALAPMPSRQASESATVEEELNSMKNLSVKEMLTVFKGSPESTPPPSPVPSPPFDDSPWKRPIIAGNAAVWPPLPAGPAPAAFRPDHYSDA